MRYDASQIPIIKLCSKTDGYWAYGHFYYLILFIYFLFLKANSNYWNLFPCLPVSTSSVALITLKPRL